MPKLPGFSDFAKVKAEQITDKITRRVVSGDQGMLVHWTIKKGAHAAAHKHPHEQIVWMISGRMDFRIGNEKRSMRAGEQEFSMGKCQLKHLATQTSVEAPLEADCKSLIEAIQGLLVVSSR